MLATDARLERVKTSWRPRLLANGITPFDYERTTQRVERFEDWPAAWVGVADEHAQLASDAFEAGRLLTAGGLYRPAALAWHFGFFAHPRPLDAWLEAQRRKADLFRKAAPYLSPPAERVSIPFTDVGVRAANDPLDARTTASPRLPTISSMPGANASSRLPTISAMAGAKAQDVALPAYLRKPIGAERPPVVLFVSGLDSTKEEHTTFEDTPAARARDADVRRTWSG